MATTLTSDIPVMDFRRQAMFLQWHAVGGTWTACDVPPTLVHGIALIRASQPNICLFGHDGVLHLQTGTDRHVLAKDAPRLRWSRGLTTLGLRRQFTLESAAGGVLFNHSYWADQGDDFFSWIARQAADPQWRAANGQRWSEGVQPAMLRSS
jgi:hypothetical protein